MPDVNEDIQLNTADTPGGDQPASSVPPTNDQPAPGDQGTPPVDAPAQDAPADAAPESPAPVNDGTVDEKTGEDTRLGKVMKALGLKKDKPVEAAAPADKNSADAQPAPATDAAATPAKDDAAAVPKEVAEHPAYKKLHDANAAMQPIVNSHIAMTQALEQNGVSGQEASRSLHLAVLAKTNPEKFFNELTAIREEYGVMLGKLIPDDLQREVDDGLITEARAKELAKARVTASAAERQVQAVQTTNANLQNQGDTTARRATVDAWFTKTGKTDPDLLTKIPDIEGEMYRLKAHHGEPADAQAQITLMDVAYKNVTARLRSRAPARKPVDPPPRSSAPANKVAAAPDNNPRLTLVRGILNQTSQ